MLKVAMAGPAQSLFDGRNMFLKAVRAVAMADAGEILSLWEMRV